mgnify:CR=1 FL=1
MESETVRVDIYGEIKKYHKDTVLYQIAQDYQKKLEESGDKYL